MKKQTYVCNIDYEIKKAFIIKVRGRKMEIYIIRHGETIWNRECRIQGRADTELSDKGRDGAIKTREELKDIRFDAVYSSPLRRAYETANIICKDRNLEINIDERLREISFGSYEGKTYDELENEGLQFSLFFDKPECFVPAKDAESFESLIERAKSFIDEIVLKYGNTDKRIMIVAHGAMNKALMLNIRKTELKDFWLGGLQKNCNAIIVSYTKGVYQILNEGN